MPFIPFRYAYLIGDLLAASVWIFLFLRRKDLRIEMFFMSKLALFWLAISYIFFAREFLEQLWVSEGIDILPKLLPMPKGVHGEDIIYTFVMGGIASVVYEEVLGKRHLKKYRKQSFFIQFALFPIIIFLSLFVGIKIFNIHPYYSSFIGFTLSAIVIFLKRRDLLIHSILSAFFLSFVYFFLLAFIFLPLFPGIVERWWHLSKVSGILIAGIPLEELGWCFFFGLFIGPSYEFLIGLKDRKNRKK